ncbi:MAG: hypothetical protein PUE49_07050 [Eggerthellales bacterium]|nr:hypothetical protein [Eggerthellales bacterium]
MTLIKCPECHNDVSDRAGICPVCGFPIAKAETDEPSARSKTIAAALVLAVLFAVCIALPRPLGLGVLIIGTIILAITYSNA